MVLYVVVVFGKSSISDYKFPDIFSFFFINCNIAMNLFFPSLKLCFDYSEDSIGFCFCKIFLVIS